MCVNHELLCCSKATLYGYVCICVCVCVHVCVFNSYLKTPEESVIAGPETDNLGRRGPGEKRFDGVEYASSARKVSYQKAQSHFLLV